MLIQRNIQLSVRNLAINYIKQEDGELRVSSEIFVV